MQTSAGCGVCISLFCVQLCFLQYKTPFSTSFLRSVRQTKKGRTHAFGIVFAPAAATVGKRCQKVAWTAPPFRQQLEVFMKKTGQGLNSKVSNDQVAQSGAPGHCNEPLEPQSEPPEAPEFPGGCHGGTSAGTDATGLQQGTGVL